MSNEMPVVETPTPLSISDFDLRTPSNKGIEIEIKRANGKGTGVFISVLGEQSEAVESYTIDRADARSAEIIAARSKDANAPLPAISVRAIMDDEIESAVVRTIGWRGLEEPFSPENARKLYQLNRTIARQVISASVNEGLFMKA